MKLKLLLLTVLVCMSFIKTVQAQIELAPEPEKKKEVPWAYGYKYIYAPYDSLCVSFVFCPEFDAYKKYIGQLVFLPKRINAPNLLRTNRIDTTDERRRITNIYKDTNSSRLYLPRYGSDYCDYDYSNIENKYYTIIDILPINELTIKLFPYGDEVGESYELSVVRKNEKFHMFCKDYQWFRCDHRTILGSNANHNCFSGDDCGYPTVNCILKLTENNSGDTVYSLAPDDFIFVGAVQKIQQKYLNQYFSVGSENRNPIRKRKCTKIIVATSGDYQGQVCLALSNPENENDIIFQKYETLAEKESKYTSSYIIPEKAIAQEKIRAAEKEKKEQQQAELQNQKKQQRKKELIQKYGEQKGKLIFEHKVEIGMTTEMCQAAYGTPTRTTSSSTSNGKTEKWYYSIGVLTEVLTLQNGVLTKISADY